MIIDARGKFTTRHLQKMKSSHGNDENIDVVLTVANEVYTTTVGNLRSIFENDAVNNSIKSDEIIDFVYEGDDVLELTGDDFLWWTKEIKGVKYARLNRLFEEGEEKVKEPKAPKQTRTSTIYVAEVATNNNGEFIDNLTCSGTEKVIVEFVNKEYVKRELRNQFANTTVFKIYKEDTVDKPEYKTLTKMIEEGDVIV